MKIAVLFDGAGLARLGLERAGHECVGVELDPWKHHLSKMVGSGNCILGDATKFDLSGFDAIWASPPCQVHSAATEGHKVINPYAGDFLDWSLNLPGEILWVENVGYLNKVIHWGKKYNAAQFLEVPLQNRNRIIGGRHKDPIIFHPYKKHVKNVCYCITATEYKGGKNDPRRASRFYGRKLTVEECAYHQGFEIPPGWYEVPEGFTKVQWRNQLYQAIGNGVPPYMSYAFGAVY